MFVSFYTSVPPLPIPCMKFSTTPIMSTPLISPSYHLLIIVCSTCSMVYWRQVKRKGTAMNTYKVSYQTRTGEIKTMVVRDIDDLAAQMTVILKTRCQIVKVEMI